MKQNDQENAVRLYAWRLRDHAGSAQYRRVTRRIHRYTKSAGCLEWADLLCSVTLVETNERGQLVRAAEWAFHTLAFGRSGLTLGPFQMKNAPWRINAAIERLILLSRQQRISPEPTDANLSSFGKLWYGHDLVEEGSALSYPSALKIAADIVRTEASGRATKYQ